MTTPPRPRYTPRHIQPGTPPTDREVQILDLVSHGCSNGVIGRRLHISEDTVKQHLRRAYVRLAVHDRAHAVRRGFELELLTADQPETPTERTSA